MMMLQTKPQGFTTVELITVIVLIGILSVFVIPRFGGTGSFESHSYRAQLLSALRLTQQRSMQYTAPTYQNSDRSIVNICHQLVFDNVQARFGLPDRTNCSVIAFPANWRPDNSGLVVDNNHSVRFSIVGVANPSVIAFDGFGRPTPTSNCPNGCVINITSSEETTQIEINSEGYIRAL